MVVALRAWWLSYTLVCMGLTWARGKMSNSQSRAHLNRVSLNISEVHAKHRRRLHRPSYRVFRRSATSVATVLRGGEELYPADPLAAKGKVGRSAFTFDHADFSPAAAKEDSEMNITVATDDRSESNDESTSLVMEEEEEVDGERRPEHTAKTTCSSSSKVTAEESLGYGKSTSSAVHSNLFVEMEDENQELQKNGNKEEDEKLLSAHDPFGFPRPREKDDAPFPTHQLILKYLMDDQLFSVQVACSLSVLLTSLVAISTTSNALYQATLFAEGVKEWGSLLRRFRDVLLPVLVANPSREDAFQRRSALAPLVTREVVYISLVLNEMMSLGEAANVVTMIRPVVHLVRSLLSDPSYIREDSLDESQRRRLLGIRIARVCFRMEALVGCVMFLTYGRGIASNIRDWRAVLKFTIGMVVYAQLLLVKHKQLEQETNFVFTAARGPLPALVCKIAEAIAFSTIAGISLYNILFISLLWIVWRFWKTEDPMATVQAAFCEALKGNMLEQQHCESAAVQDVEVGGRGGLDKSHKENENWATIIAVALGLRD